MVKVGVIDPVKVTRLALEYAASIAGLMLTTNTTITEVKADKDAVSGAVS
jgi:chaperonin GroEL